MRGVAQILDGDDYLADFARRADGAFVITERNCAVLGVALKDRHARSSEFDFLHATLPEAEVTHRVDGGHDSAFLVRPRATAVEGPPLA